MGHRSAHATPAAALEQLTVWCSLFEGCTRISDAKPRHQATVLGVIQRLRLVPGQKIEVVITDGTGRLRATFTGDPISGLELGAGLRLEGTVCTDSDMAMMRNPSWRIVRDPYSCTPANRDSVYGQQRRRQPISA